MKLQEGQRVSLNQAENGWNIASIYAGAGSVPLRGQHGTVSHVGDSMALVDIDSGPTVLVDRINDPRVKSLADEMVLDLSTWTRLAEVDQFAKVRNMSRAEAINVLVNQGLSTL